MQISASSNETMKEVASLLRQAERVLFITGAGISVASGLPTYRGNGGVYAGGVTEDGIPYELALSGQMLETRPEITWRELIRIAQRRSTPVVNAGHRAIASVPGATVLTQNVDGLHRAAGSQDVIEIHGNTGTLLCTGCGHRDTESDWRSLPIPPRCPRCDTVLRPEVVLFGEALPERELDRLDAALARGFDMVFTIGTTSVFPYIAEPVIMASRRGIPTVEINPELTEVSYCVQYRLTGCAADMLPGLIARPDEP
ncbi:MAG: NAD-dependent protein deacylase [Ectothiorhodospiraceae bacterium]|nr:NAD-dependent protein deacylase [Ectothiorhodospiraceae bacterium]MCH8503650.1 NAD-dependent protein deacylase [Ectothiorhodospiraceae bacterium]